MENRSLNHLDHDTRALITEAWNKALAEMAGDRLFAPHILYFEGAAWARIAEHQPNPEALHQRFTTLHPRPGLALLQHCGQFTTSSKRALISRVISDEYDFVHVIESGDTREAGEQTAPYILTVAEATRSLIYYFETVEGHERITVYPPTPVKDQPSMTNDSTAITPSVQNRRAAPAPILIADPKQLKRVVLMGRLSFVGLGLTALGLLLMIVRLFTSSVSIWIGAFVVLIGFAIFRKTSAVVNEIIKTHGQPQAKTQP